MNSSKSTISKKHLIAIAVVLALGGGAGTYILQGGGKPKTATTEGDGHGHGGHTEAKGHGDGEHHDAKRWGEPPAQRCDTRARHQPRRTRRPRRDQRCPVTRPPLPGP